MSSTQCTCLRDFFLSIVSWFVLTKLISINIKHRRGSLLNYEWRRTDGLYQVQNEDEP